MEARGRMSPDWNPENITNFILCIGFLFGSLFLFRNIKTPDLKQILYLRLIWVLTFLFFLFEALASLFMEPLFSRLSGMMNLCIAVALVLVVNYALNEYYPTFTLITLGGVGTLMFYLALQPDSVVPGFMGEYPTLQWAGLFRILCYLLSFFYLLYFFVWAVKIRRNIPFEIKREGNIMLLGATIIGGPLIIITLIAFWISILVIVVNLVILLALAILTWAILKEPKLLFVLPFTPYRIVVLNNKGDLLYQHLWSKFGMSEPQFTQYMGLIQKTPEGRSSIEGILEIHIKEGVIIFVETESLRVGLFISKASKFLRELLLKFTQDFETKFQDKLGAGSKDPADFKSATELVLKYFLIFPSRLIDEEKKPLFLSKKVYKIPPTLETKLKEIIKDEKAFDAIKCEIQRSFEKGLPSEFLELYEELKDQTEEFEEEDSK